MRLSDLATLDIANAIQLSIAPVFLLNGIAVLLGVFTNRLGRCVDRARVLEAEFATANEAQQLDLRGRLRTLRKRARLINAAISLATLGALLVALMVILMFGSGFVRTNLAGPVTWLFASAMLALICSLIVFLVEVRVATATLRIGIRP